MNEGRASGVVMVCLRSRRWRPAICHAATCVGRCVGTSRAPVTVCGCGARIACTRRFDTAIARRALCGDCCGGSASGCCGCAFSRLSAVEGALLIVRSSDDGDCLRLRLATYARPRTVGKSNNQIKKAGVSRVCSGRGRAFIEKFKSSQVEIRTRVQTT
jgi:hypothetical protein